MNTAVAAPLHAGKGSTAREVPGERVELISHGHFIVDLASRVAMHALRASWFQKWVVHRRLRPEELGGRLEAAAAGAPLVAWPNAVFRITFAVLRPTPGRASSNSRDSGTWPPCCSISARQVAMTFLALVL